ncbi:bifunctional inhibitor/lipid-transfer protein/seed storage 2S albumin superfamily protein [Actinidia rufa]|uniref:Bifunctional inhibitor/lipid-transfer protein/seed storage 2S albumin superfamily protein n=1 Tax=Actinidia rufa TaxID=165716 RepID=A0A7J0EX19_9ERIC|nr:bifunctional inhibitor/lipid-transfer protein/seed storage 2S albumin superfamily protein [Actinidia rufa]
MAIHAVTLSLLIPILSLCFSGTVQSTTAPAPAVDCSSVFLNLADCLSYVTGNDSVKKPEGTCCSGLKTVLKTEPECLCEAFKSSAQLGVTLNITRALALPLRLPSLCPFLSIGGGAPATSPAGALSPSTPTSVPGVSEITPASAPRSSGSVSPASIVSLALALVFASFSSI